MSTALRESRNALRATYWIEYAGPAPDGKYHKVRVSCARKGAHAAVEQGYFASDPSGAADDEVVRQMVESPFDAADIGLRATLSRENVSSTSLRLGVRADASDALLQPQSGGYSGQLQLTVASNSNAAKAISNPETESIRLSAEQRSSALRDGVSIGEFTVDTAAIRKVRIVVRDLGSNAAGSLTITRPVNQ